MAAARRKAVAREYDVIIVGGGFSGLAAADRINVCNSQRAGHQISFVVLDGARREGGRTVTVHPELGYLDLGGQYLTDPAEGFQPQIHELISRFNVELSNCEIPNGPARIFESNLIGRQEYTELLPNVPELVDFVGHIESLVAKMKMFIGHPWNAPDAVRMDRLSVATWSQLNAPNEVIAELVKIGVQSAYSVEPGDISYLHYLHYGATCETFENYELLGEARRMKHGTLELYERIVESLPADSVQRPQLVREIEQAPARVTVRTKEGKIFTARRLILAMSPMASRHIRWIPEQSQRRIRLCAGAPTARTIKGFVIFREPFWRPRFAGYSISAVGPIVWVKEVINELDDGRLIPTLMLFVTGDQAEPWSKQSPAAKKAVILQQLARTFDTTPSRVASYWVDHVEYDWGRDALARGCPAGCFRPGVLTQLVDGLPAGVALANPDGRVHFAGSETGRNWQGGYMNGAVEAGQRAAEEVIAAL